MRTLTKVWSATRIIASMGTIAALAATSAQAQDLTGRWRIDLRTGVGVGVNSGTSISTHGVETTTDAAGFFGTLSCSHWFSEDLAGSLSIGVLSVASKVRAGTGGVETSTALVMPFFVGLRRYLTKADTGSGTSFFGSLEVGPVTGHESATRVGSTIVVESIARSALGGRIGTGAEFRLGSRMVLGIVGGYTFMTDFSDPIGGRKNHSGADFGVSFGVLIGS